MKGYIGVTDPGWYEFHKLSHHNEVIFWRRSSTPVNLHLGDYFFFLIKGPLPRVIKGFGTVAEVNVKTPRVMWDMYGNENGCNTLTELNARLNKSDNEQVAFYRITEVVYLDDTRIVTDEEIGFAKSVIAGKFIDSDEVNQLLNYYKNGTKPTFVKHTNLNHEDRVRIWKRETRTPHVSMLELNMENIIAERISDIEDGLKLIKRQYSIPPVGRIDLLCEDKKGDLVVIELKKYGADTRSVIDQIIAYMGYIKKHVAKQNQLVRGFVIVGEKNERLEYSALVVPNLEIKSFKFNFD